MRRSAAPVITAQTYRHFATVTVAITALVAFFANGEKQQASPAKSVTSRSQTIDPRAQNQHLQDSRSEADANPEIWGSDDSGGFGQPMIRTPTPRSWFSSPVGPNSERRAGADDEALPTNPEESDHVAGSGGPPSPTTSQIAAAAAASRLRSGASGDD